MMVGYIRNYIIGFLIICLCFSFSIPAIAAPTVELNGNQLVLDVQPKIENGRTLVPLRTIFEALGANVSWDANTQTITAVRGATSLKLMIGETTAYKNGTAIVLDVCPKIINGRTLVPLRFVSEALGAMVTWEASTEKILIQSQKKEFDVLYDDFTQPLSNNWDLSSRKGDWAIEPGKGAYVSANGRYAGFLTFNLNEYMIPQSYTLESEIIMGERAESGFFIKGSKELSGKTYWSNWPPSVFISQSDNYTRIVGTDHSSYLPHDLESVRVNETERYEPGKCYKLKVVVAGKKVDIYVDGIYKSSTVFSDEGAKGALIGITSNRRVVDGKYVGGYIKSFKIINNDYKKSTQINQKQVFNVLYDDFNQPLSQNWDLSSRKRSWSVSPGKGAYISGEGQFMGFLTYNLQNYVIPKNYILESEVIMGKRGNLGVFFKGWKELEGDSSWDFFPPYVSISTTDSYSLIYGKSSYSYLDYQSVKVDKYIPGKNYKLKVVVTGKKVDVYVNGRHKFSTVLTDEGAQGVLVGIVADRKIYKGEYSGGYIKNFKIINNDYRKTIKSNGTVRDY